MNTVSTQEEFDRLVENGVTFVKITSPTCGPCKSYKPVFEKFAAENPDVKCCSIDASELPEVPALLGVRRVPTTLVMKNGVAEIRLDGVQSIEALRVAKSQV